MTFFFRKLCAMKDFIFVLSRRIQALFLFLFNLELFTLFSLSIISVYCIFGFHWQNVVDIVHHHYHNLIRKIPSYASQHHLDLGKKKKSNMWVPRLLQVIAYATSTIQRRSYCIIIIILTTGANQSISFDVLLLLFFWQMNSFEGINTKIYV